MGSLVYYELSMSHVRLGLTALSQEFPDLLQRVLPAHQLVKAQSKGGKRRGPSSSNLTCALQSNLANLE